MATTKSALLGTAASIAASAVLVRTLASDFLPSSLRDYLSDAFASLLGSLSSQLTITVEEFDGPMPNHMYKAAESYLATKLSPSTRRIRVAKQEEDSDSFEVRIDREQEIVDIFEGIEFRWRLTAETTLPSLGTFRHHYNEPTAQESKLFELSFHKKHRDAALNSYLPFVVSQAKAIKAEAKTLKLHTNNDEYWESVNLRYPATFETMALDADVKREVMEDLARFVKRKDYYKKIGKAWKRGYLLYGPPGTGKSSLVAAMANLLRFDVYDLELTEVRSNSGLRSLLGGVANRSILVVEDIDCAMDLGPRENKRGGSRHKGDSDSESEDQGKVTLAGLLNFVDGLWSSCGDERIIIFTTNHKDRLDPALLRPGRMDVHIHMNYCNPTGFRVLASNYHSIDDHPLFGEIEGMIGEAAITPAEVAEELMKTDDTEVALQGLIKVLREKKNKEDNEAQNKEDDDEAQNKEDEEKQDWRN